MSEEWSANARAWRAKLKAPTEADRTWRVMLWGDAEAWPADLRGEVVDPMPLFKDPLYSEYEEMYHAYKNNIERADIIRYIMLHKWGGVYADMDTRPNYSITPLLALYEQEPKIDTIVASSNFMKDHASNWFFVAKASSSFLSKILQEAKKRSGRSYVTRHFGVMYRTGPMLVNTVAGTMKLSVKLIPEHVLNSCSECKGCDLVGLRVLENTHGMSWCGWDSKIANSLACLIVKSQRISIQAWIGIFLLTLLLIFWLFRKVMSCKVY